MLLTQVISDILKSRRFYLWSLFFACAGIVIRFLPVQAQNSICDMYRTYLEEPIAARIDTFFAYNGSTIAAETAGDLKENRAAAALSNANITSADVKDMVRVWACPALVSHHDETNHVSDPSSIYSDVPQILAGAFILAFVATFVSPAPAKSPANSKGLLPVVLAKPPDGYWRWNTRLHVGLAYALLSCAACILTPPLFESSQTFWSGAQAPHLLTNAAAAALAGTWGTWRFRRAQVPIYRVAFYVAFAGVFFAGLIALLISMPYRIMTPIEAAQLGFSQVKIITAIRLIALPSIAAGASFGAITIGRRLARVPINVFHVHPVAEAAR